MALTPQQCRAIRMSFANRKHSDQFISSLNTLLDGGTFGASIDLSEMTAIANNRVVGNVSGGSAAPSELTAAQLATLIGGSGKLAQVVTSLSGAMATGTTTIPHDDTIPQNTEGTEFYTVAITPTNASSTIVVFCHLEVALSANYVVLGALFKDSVANALACGGGCHNVTNNTPMAVHFMHAESAGSTDARTYKLRGGPIAAGTVTVNGTGGARKFGGVQMSGIIVAEVLP